MNSLKLKSGISHSYIDRIISHENICFISIISHHQKKMEIVSIEVYQADLPLIDGPYAWADGKSVDKYDSTVVIITTNTGVRGVGETVPLGPNYLPSYAAGVR